MSKCKASSHYVPRLVLRKFSDNLCIYNVRTGILQENIAPEHAFENTELYDDETERNLNIKIESQFGNLLSNVILKEKDIISLSRKQLLQVKKFLLISTLRTMQNEDLLQFERQNKNLFDYPFEEKNIEGETPFKYWMRTLNVILESDGTPLSVSKHPNATFAAYRWANVINSGYVAFWDAPEGGDEFLITDIGMTSENEKGWDGHYVHNDRKLSCLKFLLGCCTNEIEKNEINRFIYNTCSFSENFMMFPISAKRMIVLICPFYKFRYFCKQSGLNIISLDDLTVIPNERLYEPNRNYYEMTQRSRNTLQFHENDRYIYDIKKLSCDEIRYCNALFMDRIDTFLGFSSLDNAVSSIINYKKLNDPHYVPRVDYKELYKIIENRSLGNLNI